LSQQSDADQVTKLSPETQRASSIVSTAQLLLSLSVAHVRCILQQEHPAGELVEYEQTATMTGGTDNISVLGRAQMLLSPNVAYVRSILLEELAKGIDSASRLAADTAVARLRSSLSTAPRVELRKLKRSNLPLC